MLLRIRRLLVSCVLLAVAGAAAAQTPWPPAMATFTRGPSDSRVPARLPPPVVITPAAADVPAPIAAFSGVWHGWACPNAACDIELAVEQVRADGATVSYAGANAMQGLITDKAQARFADGELQMTVKTGARIAMRLRADGDMELAISRDGKLLSAGVLSQRPADYERSVERVPTPWVEQGAPVTLEMVVYKPFGPGPFPTLVFNHGSTGLGDRPDFFTLTWTAAEVGRYFVRQGWQVVFPQRRGRGTSGGLYDEGFEPDRSRYSCEPKLALAGLERALLDLDAVMRTLAQRQDIDASRVLIGGVSRGGILASVYAGLHPALFTGVVNFVGGWVGDVCPGAIDVNPVAFRRAAGFGRPMLWLYGEKDPYYSLAHSRANFRAFTQAGGKGEFVAFDAPPGADGHAIYAFPQVWRPAVEKYLTTLEPQGR